MNRKTGFGVALIGCLALFTGGLLAPAAQAVEAGDLLWARSAGGGGFEASVGIAVDAAGNSLVAGYFQGSTTLGAGEANETTLTAAGGEFDIDVFIAKYAPNGILLWARSAGGAHSDLGQAVAVDAAGNVLVTGNFQVSAIFGAGEANETTLIGAGLYDLFVFVAKYAPDGTLRWARSAGGGNHASGWGIAAAAAGNALVTGDFDGSATFGAGEANETTLTAAGLDDVFIARYGPDGTLAWARSAGGSGLDFSNEITMDSVGNVLLTGGFDGNATFGAGEVNETTLTAAGLHDAFIARYGPDGTLLWARSAGGGNYATGWSIAVDAAGNALVTGDFDGSTTFGAGEANETTVTAAGLLTSSSHGSLRTGPWRGRARRAVAVGTMEVALQ